MLYNSTFSYNSSGILYTGSLILNIPGIYNPILINDIRIIIDPVEDYSNNTTIGIVTYDISATGVMSFQTTESQAEAIVGSQVITLNSFSGEVAIQAI
jgi:hypothetical protein